MADSDGGGNERNSNYSRKSSDQKDDEGSEDGAEDNEDSFHPDLGLGASSVSRNLQGGGCSSGAGCGTDGLPKREEGAPFSFKHFLSSCGPVGGARPKVYTTPTPPSSPSPRILPNPEMTSGLPDFVQDHLVIEQCYLNSSAPSQISVDLDNIILPEYNSLDPENEFSPGRSDIPFDLPRRGRINELPLDLPDRLPFDLPRSREPPQNGEVGSSKSLPDFLSDGPIRNERRPDQLSADHVSPSGQFSPDLRHSPDHRLHIENERLRRELDTLRIQLSDQIRRNEALEAELCVSRSRLQSEVISLEKMVEQDKETLKRVSKRAVNAENQAAKMKELVQRLTCEVNSLRNCRSRDVGSVASSSAMQTDNERLASQLRNAANTAELSLRHLLLGVDNLRELAKSLEPPQNPRYRISSDDDSQDETEPGPAL